MTDLMDTAVLEPVAEGDPLPGMAERIWDLRRDPAAGVRRVAALISRDPVLSARVLRLANASFYRQAGRISELRRAVLVIGVNGISRILISYLSGRQPSI